MDTRVPRNFFSGENQVPLEATLGEVETLNSASDDVKALSDSGALNEIHRRCNDLTEASEAQFVAIRDRIENIINTAAAKEEEIYEDHEDVLRGGISSFFSRSSDSKLAALVAELGKNENDKESLKDSIA